MLVILSGYALCLRVNFLCLICFLMASSSRGGGKKGNSKRSRVVDSSVSQRDPNPSHQNSGELDFLDSQQEARYHNFLGRRRATQKFVDMPTLKSLHIHDHVRVLFRNIGWEGLLSLHDVGYLQPTLEFLSSVSFNRRTEYLSFRAFSRNY